MKVKGVKTYGCGNDTGVNLNITPTHFTNRNNEKRNTGKRI